VDTSKHVLIIFEVGAIYNVFFCQKGDLGNLPPFYKQVNATFRDISLEKVFLLIISVCF